MCFNVTPVLQSLLVLSFNPEIALLLVCFGEHFQQLLLRLYPYTQKLPISIPNNMSVLRGDRSLFGVAGVKAVSQMVLRGLVHIHSEGLVHRVCGPAVVAIATPTMRLG